MSRIYDEQRQTLAQNLPVVLQTDAFATDKIFQEIAEDFVQSEPALGQAVQLKKNSLAMRLADADALRDAALRACDLSFELAIQVAIAEQDEEQESELSEAQAHIFPQNVGAIAKAPYQAESGFLNDIIVRCRETELQTKLKEAGILPHFERLALLQEKFESIESSSKDQKSLDQGETKEIQAARKRFDHALSRLVKYAGVRFQRQDPTQLALYDKIMLPIQRARQAAARERAQRKQSKAKQTGGTA